MKHSRYRCLEIGLALTIKHLRKDLQNEKTANCLRLEDKQQLESIYRSLPCVICHISGGWYIAKILVYILSKGPSTIKTKSLKLSRISLLKIRLALIIKYH